MWEAGKEAVQRGLTVKVYVVVKTGEDRVYICGVYSSKEAAQKKVGDYPANAPPTITEFIVDQAMEVTLIPWSNDD
jgi:hypothetical protein